MILHVYVYTMAASFAIPDLIVKKRNGQALTTEEIKYFIQEVVNGGIQQCQLGKRERDREICNLQKYLRKEREIYNLQKYLRKELRERERGERHKITR